MDTSHKYSLLNKIIAFGGDNTNTNFGGAARRGTGNIFVKLSTQLGHKIVGVGCSAHVVHNCIQAGADSLPVDVAQIVNKIYQYFHIYTVRVERLKTFCDMVETEYKQILGHCNTRWLLLLPAIERILNMYEALKSFCLNLIVPQL